MAKKDEVAAPEAEVKSVIPEGEDARRDDLLSDEEKEALSDGFDWKSEPAATSDEDDEDDTDQDEDDDDDGADATAEDHDQDSDDDDQGADKGDEKADTDAETPPEPYKVPDDVLMGDALDAKLAELKADKDKLLDDLEDGEIDRDEYRSKLAEIEGEANTLSVEAAKHQAILEDHQKALETSWKKSLTSYMAEHEGLKDEAVLRAFDATVRAMNKNPLYDNMSNDKFLAAAHDTLHAQAEHLGLDVPARAKKADTGKKEKLKAKPASERPGAPRTLRDVPASDPAGAGDNRFAPVDAMMASNDAAKIEKTLQSMTEEQMEEWLRSA